MDMGGASKGAGKDKESRQGGDKGAHKSRDTHG